MSRIKNRGAILNGVASCNCCATQASVGCRVTPTWTTRHDPSAMTKQAYSDRQRRSVIGRKSHAQIAPAWLRTKADHVWPVGRRGRAERS